MALAFNQPLNFLSKLEAPPGFEPGVEILQLDLTPRSLSKSVDLLNASARLMLLSSAEECPVVPRWLDFGYSDSRPVLGRLRRR